MIDIVEFWGIIFIVKTSGSEETFEETSISSPLVIKMSQSEIDKHTGTILLQLEVTEFLASCENNDVFPMQVFSEIYSNLGKLSLLKAVKKMFN